MSLKSQSFHDLVMPIVYDGSELLRTVNVRTLTILVEYLDKEELIKTEKLVHSYMRSRKMESFKSILHRFLSARMNSDLNTLHTYFSLLTKLESLNTDIEVANFYIKEVIQTV